MATINTNLGAVRAANALATNERDMNGAMERLSTGKRINTAQDDAAGLAIASKMTSRSTALIRPYATQATPFHWCRALTGQ